MAVYKYGQGTKTALPTATATEQTAEIQQDNGGFLGGVEDFTQGLGYLAQKFGGGFLSTFEGVWDYTAGGLASMLGGAEGQEWAEQQFKNDWIDYSHPDSWYQPSDGWKTAGDIAAGIGNSTAALVPLGVAAGIAFVSGGTLTPVAMGIVSATGATLAGLGAAGQSTKQAYQESGKLGQAEYGYGALSGVTEGALEAATNIIGAGSGTVAKSLSKVAAKEATETVAKKGLAKLGGDLVKGFAGEAFEEGMSAILEPQFAKITYNPDAQNATMQEVMYSAFVGGMSGMIMGGTTNAFDTVSTRVQDTAHGKEYVESGKAEQMLEGIRQIAEFERQNKTGDRAFEYTLEVYDKLQASIKENGGTISTKEQMRMLGEGVRYSAFAPLSAMTMKEVANVYYGAEAIAEQYNAYYRDAQGERYSITAEQIREGIDPKDRSTFAKALQENAVLRGIAIAGVTGNLFMDTTLFAQNAMQGGVGVSQTDIDRFVETADDAKIDAFKERYGIDMRNVTADEFNTVMRSYMGNGGAAVEQAEVRRSRAFTDADGTKVRKSIPKAANIKDGETVRYQVGDEDFAIRREGDGYYVHDYKTGRTTRKLTRAELNKRLAGYRAQSTMATPDKGEGTEKAAAEQADAWAMDNVVNYNRLGSKDRVRIRRLIRNARANGVVDADIAIYASISARSGVDISFVTDKADTENNGYYDIKNDRIVVNLATTPSAESTIIHELDHAIRKEGKFFRPYNEAADTLTDAEIAEIQKRYADETENGLLDELTAHGAEKLLAGKGVLDSLIAEQPKLLDRILAWFKGAEADYKPLPKLSKEAQKYYKIFKKRFDALSQRNFEGIAVRPTDGVAFRFNRAAVDSHTEELKKNYAKADAAIPLEDILKQYERIVSMWDKVGKELDSAFLRRWNERQQDKAFTIFKEQSGYKYNVELSSMCKKGIPLFEAIDSIVASATMEKEGINRLGKAEKEILYGVLKEHHFDIPCAICFVEQARQREGAVIDAFADGDSAKGKLGWNQAITAVEERMSQKLGRKFAFGSFGDDIATETYEATDVILTEEEQNAFYEALAEEAMVAINARNADTVEYNKKHKSKPRKMLPNKVTAEGVRRYYEARTVDARKAAKKAIFGGQLPANVKIFSVMMQDPNARRHIKAQYLYSSRTTRNLAVYTPLFYSLFNSQGGTAGYKTKQTPIAYWGELLGKKWTSKQTKDEGGIRNQSNSDFQVYQFLDYVQMYLDLTAKGYYLQAYTKSVEELKLFGKSRSKINASLVPLVKIYLNADGTIDEQRTRENAGLDENGNPIYDDVEGIIHSEAFALISDPEYSKNITGICIGYSDNHILKLLDEPLVQMVIGYHDKTNDPSKRYPKARYATNYTGRNEATKKGDSIVSEIDVEAIDEDDGGKKVKHINFTQFLRKAEKLFKDKKLYDAETETYSGEITHDGKTYTADDIPMLAADLYRSYCDSHGLAPAYSRGGYDFSTHPNYYKLLADYGLKDSEGHYAPHRKVAFSLPDTVPVLQADGSTTQVGTQEYLKSRLEAELKVRDDLAQQMPEIIDDFVKGVQDYRAEVQRAQEDAKTGIRRSRVLGQSAMTGGSIEQTVTENFVSHMQDIKERTGKWKADDVFAFMDEHPELDFIPRIYTKDKTAKADLEAFLAKIEDADTLEWYEWYVSSAYNIKETKSAVKTFRKAVRRRVNEIYKTSRKGRKLGIKNGEVTLTQVKELFESLNKNKEIGAFAQRVFATVEKLGVNIRFTDTVETEFNGQAFGDMVEYRTNYFNDKGFSDQEKAGTLLHELLHTCTAYAIRLQKSEVGRSKLSSGMIKAIEGLKSIYAEIHDDNNFKGQYGVTSVSEMIAELANPEFVSLMKRKTLWDRIVDFIAQFFGFRRGTSAYDNAMVCLEYALDNPSVEAYRKYSGSIRKLASGSAFGQTVMPNGEVRHSRSASSTATTRSLTETDKAYITAVERGDMQAAQRMVDEAAKAAGYTVRITSAAPVTYDAEGNIIPLSERFNPQNSDIRYSRKKGAEAEYTRTYTSPTLGSVLTQPVGEVYKPETKEKIHDAIVAWQIAMTNAQAGIEWYGRKHGIEGIEAIVQTVRSAQSQADEMVTGNQYRIGDTSKAEKEYQGKGLHKILEPVKAKGEQYTEDFFDYLGNQLNIDRMTLEQRSIEENNARIKERDAKKADIARMQEEIKQKQERLKELAKKRSKAAMEEKRRLRAEIREIGKQIKQQTVVVKALDDVIANFVPKENKAVMGIEDENGNRREVTAEESEKIVAEYEKAHPEFKGIADELYAFLRNLNQYRVDTGLLSIDMADYLAYLYPHYVPAFRVKYMKGVAAIEGQGAIRVKQTVKTAKGSTEKIQSPLQMIERQVRETIAAGQINRLANALYEAALGSGDNVDIEIVSRNKATVEDLQSVDLEKMRPKNNEITFYRDGELVTMRVSSQIAAGFDAFIPKLDAKNPAVAAVTWINKAFKSLVTSWNPAFLARNSIRDIQDAGINTKYAKTFLRNYARAIEEIRKDGKYWRLYRAMGGFSSSVFDFKDGYTSSQNAMGLTRLEGNLLKKGLTAIENANAFVEQLPRLAEFISAMEAGKTAEQALLDAADVTTNFGRSGKVVNVLNRTLVPFLNASVQGFSKLIRNVTSIRTAREAASLAARVALIGLLPQAINMLMYGGDDDYEELRETDKENNFLIKVGDKFIKLPRGRVSSVVGGAMNRISAAASGKRVDVWDYVENVTQQITPVDSMSRNIFSPVTDVINNVTWYGSAIEGREMENRAPKDRYDASTSSIAKAITDALHAIGFGGSMSPKKMHYLIDQYSGVIGDFILPMTTAKAEKDFFSGNFTIDPTTSNKLSSEFYYLYDEATYAKTSGDEIAIYQLKYLNKVKSAISELYDRKAEIEMSNLSDKEKRDEVAVIQALINEAYKTAITDYDLYTTAIQSTEGIDPKYRGAETTRRVYGAERALKDYDSSVYEKATVLNKAGVSYDAYYNYYFAKQSIEPETDKNGNPVSGSKRKSVIAAINSLDATRQEKMLLVYASGYTIQNNDIKGVSAATAKTLLWRYLSSLKNLTDEERKYLAEMCGFSVKNGRIVMNK